MRKTSGVGNFGLRGHYELPKTIKTDLVLFLLVIVFVLGLIAGYAWRMSQTADTMNLEANIVTALQICEPLQTEELVIQPVHDCLKNNNTAIIGLTKKTWNY